MPATSPDVEDLVLQLIDRVTALEARLGEDPAVASARRREQLVRLDRMAREAAYARQRFADVYGRCPQDKSTASAVDRFGLLLARLGQWLSQADAACRILRANADPKGIDDLLAYDLGPIERASRVCERLAIEAELQSLDPGQYRTDARHFLIETPRQSIAERREALTARLAELESEVTP